MMRRLSTVPSCAGTSSDFCTPAAESQPKRGASSSRQDIGDPVAVGVGDISTIRTINRGAFSTVALVLDRTSGRYCALKAASKTSLLRVGAAHSIVREKEALLALQPHPFVVQLFWTAQDDEYLYLLLQLGLGGDLRGVLLRRRQSSYGPALAEEQARCTHRVPLTAAPTCSEL